MSTTLRPIRPKPPISQGTYEHTTLPRDPLQAEGRRKRKRESGLQSAVSSTPSSRDGNSESHIAPQSLSPGLSSSSSSSRSSSRSNLYPIPHPQVCHPNPISIPTKTDSGPYTPIPKPKPKLQTTPCVCECIEDDIDYPFGPGGLKTKNLLRVVVEYQKSIYAWQALAERNRREAEGWKWLVCRDSQGDVDDMFLDLGTEGEEEIPMLGREHGYGGNLGSADVSGWYSVMSSRMDRQERRRLELEHECWILRDKVSRLESLISTLKKDEPVEKGVHTGPRLTLDVVAETSRGRGQGRGQRRGGSTWSIEEVYLSPPAQPRYGHDNAELENEAQSVFVHQLFPGLASLPSPTEIESDLLPPTPISNPIPTLASVQGPERIPDFEMPTIDADFDNEDEDGSVVDYGPYLLTPANVNLKWTESNSPISPLFEPVPFLDPQLDLPLTPMSMISESLSDRPSMDVRNDTSFNEDSSSPSRRSASGSLSAAKTSGCSSAIQGENSNPDTTTETDIDIDITTTTNDDDLRSRSTLEGFVDWAKSAVALIEREREYDRVGVEREKQGEGSLELDQLEWTWGLIREFQDCIRSVVMVDEIGGENEGREVLS